jgi:hypothetical protein
MDFAPKTLAKSLFIMLLENYPNQNSPTVFFRQTEKLNRCFVLYAEILPDRGAEGQLTSLCSQTRAFLKRLKSVWTNASPEKAARALEQDKEVEGPPLPIQTAFS